MSETSGRCLSCTPYPDGGAPLRFTEFRKELPDISQKVLTSTLRHLEEDGFVTRTVYPEVPPRVEYQLTERGRSFLLACRPMIDWVLAHMAAILKERQAKRGNGSERE
ncbi:MAG: winged helix-turn-helix transcriptional regulator [Parabacteroides sp.]